LRSGAGGADVVTFARPVGVQRSRAQSARIALAPLGGFNDPLGDHLKNNVGLAAVVPWDTDGIKYLSKQPRCLSVERVLDGKWIESMDGHGLLPPLQAGALAISQPAAPG
jgi:hypothetical protein